MYRILLLGNYMKNLWMISLSLFVAFISCKGKELESKDKEKAKALSSEARDLLWGANNTIQLETLPDITPVLEKIDSAIALDPENKRYYYKKPTIWILSKMWKHYRKYPGNSLL